MEAIFNKHVGIFPNALSKDFCNDLIQAFGKSQKVNRDKSTQLNEIIVKDTTAYDVDKKYSDYVFQVLNKSCLLSYLTKYSGYKDIFHQNNLQMVGFNVQKTEPSEGYHIWHSEWAPVIGVAERTLVWTLYLNDVEEGGETEFLDISLRVKAKQGTVCIFPSHPTHFHRGNPPISGTKYIATGWIGAIDPANSLPRPKA